MPDWPAWVLLLAWLLWPAEREYVAVLHYELVASAADAATVDAPPCGAGVVPTPGRPCWIASVEGAGYAARD